VSRPDVSVVMPLAGGAAAAAAAVQALRSLGARPGDELILVDNSLTGAAADVATSAPVVTVITASGEASPAHARNVGAARAKNEWILFLDADTWPRAGLLDAFFDGDIPPVAGAVAGEITAAPDQRTLAGRYSAARSFLSQRAHHAHAYRPRAAAANLLVRRAAFEQLGGFYEGVRAAEDTDFTWRLQEAGWHLELRPQAQVEHRYRASLTELRRQWRGYAAGRAWLARRYADFAPEPALRRFIRRARAKLVKRGPEPPPGRSAPPVEAGVLERGRFAALDALLALDELAGLALSNRPASDGHARPAGVDVVLVADRFPARDDPLVELAQTLEHVRVEAMARPSATETGVQGRIPVDYLEDDGRAARALAAAGLGLRHPVRSARDLLTRGAEAPPLRVLAPAVRRLERNPAARLHALGGGRSHDFALRLAWLAGRQLDA
jgi:GT2 family glycosyltransferase